MSMNNTIIERNGKVFLLAYDQGFEHGPVDFNEKNIDPQFVIDLANSGTFTGLVLQEGVAAHYYKPAEHKFPLIVKLNGKTSFHSGEEPYSPQLCTVKKAIELGAKAVGYTIYVGSEHEAKMMQEFSLLEDEAHAAGLAVIAWMYPRGAKVAGKEESRDVVAYAARLGLELNADYVKIPYPGSQPDMEWVVKSAGKTGVLVQGGLKKDWPVLEAETKAIMASGAKGLAIGRNVWQAVQPQEVANKIAGIIFGKANV
jgi:class I fructose-bisphosphate aldolase